MIKIETISILWVYTYTCHPTGNIIKKMTFILKLHCLIDSSALFGLAKIFLDFALTQFNVISGQYKVGMYRHFNSPRRHNIDFTSLKNVV